MSEPIENNEDKKTELRFEQDEAAIEDVDVESEDDGTQNHI